MNINSDSLYILRTFRKVCWSRLTASLLPQQGNGWFYLQQNYEWRIRWCILIKGWMITSTHLTALFKKRWEFQALKIVLSSEIYCTHIAALISVNVGIFVVVVKFIDSGKNLSNCSWMKLEDLIHNVSIVEYMKSICVIFCCGVRLSCYQQDESSSYPFPSSFPILISIFQLVSLHPSVQFLEFFNKSCLHVFSLL